MCLLCACGGQGSYGYGIVTGKHTQTVEQHTFYYVDFETPGKTSESCLASKEWYDEAEVGDSFNCVFGITSKRSTG